MEKYGLNKKLGLYLVRFNVERYTAPSPRKHKKYSVTGPLRYDNEFPTSYTGIVVGQI